MKAQDIAPVACPAMLASDLYRARLVSSYSSRDLGLALKAVLTKFGYPCSQTT